MKAIPPKDLLMSPAPKPSHNGAGHNGEGDEGGKIVNPE